MQNNQESVAKLIKIALIQKGITQAQIARELNLTRQAVNEVINKGAKSKRIKEYLRKRLGIAI